VSSKILGIPSWLGVFHYGYDKKRHGLLMVVDSFPTPQEAVRSLKEAKIAGVGQSVNWIWATARASAEAPWEMFSRAGL